MSKQIVALGGGGFSYEPEFPYLDRYILDLTGKEQPKVCFLPQASAESEIYIVRFYRAFTELGAIPSWQGFFREVPLNFGEHLLEQDVIYVGGGNTFSMLAIWKAWGVDKILAQALENGTILAGISAGAICWFEQCVTDSAKPMTLIEGLGWLEGSCSPHYDGEAMRRPTVARLLKDGMLPCTALDDYAAAHYVDGELHQVITSRKTANSFRVTLDNGDVIETTMKSEYIGE
ncbi:MAG: peptidase E [Chloroflexota bacterium]